MTKKLKIKNLLIASLVALSLGGWLLHLKVHAPSSDAADYIPFLSGIFSVFILPVMFYFRASLPYAYVLNGMTVIIGTITMAHFSIAHMAFPVTIGDIILRTTLADILLLWGKFFAGKAVFDLEYLKNDTDPAQKGRYFRYPNMGWWLVHLILMAAVYALGNIYWL
ncbi:MAG TPA: hypothetical protein DEE98_05045 [Elusimicrobia bacterium]|nr:MAG: hypothetical protein A2278_04720 [Elusimicrobia bacterium RIFOXYA12_FULL_49_49]OGS10236.1 MAG: hypothetical protein A2386_08055 [Elusimicrobia bacterium RIFOXYB1_FULL_48_9]OGS14650.1 MAG: hypothetical protein A2251_09120 [Elusimicrobia bacterium RIFOXYA2_FULL_47_53]OGS25697.1 MAG: hypothetical protein A2339_06470 [Elusimicrobia bacterium RIFOXYB12_FULL_50_12]OGS31741.1 MAG: hypothetical protein A2323_06030 [Elusimicrobia bacterium RIFOXYB2_FULL_46_23]HBU69731.1 hypothetical protein [El